MTVVGIGETAPEFEPPDENGNKVGLSKSSGPNVLIFYRGDW